MSKEGQSAKALETRSRILRAALGLFNDRGYSKVTTHDIALVAGMSPGNLYYHFRNKEEIVREIFLGMEIFSSSRWYEKGPLNPKGSFADFMRFFFGNLDQYRFFFREFSLITRTVPALEPLLRERWRHLMVAMRQAVGLWQKAGFLKTFDSPEAVDAFIENCWVLTNFSGVHREILAEPGSPRGREFERLLRYLYPYHTPRGQRTIDLYLNS